MLPDPETLDLLPRAAEVRRGGRRRPPFKLELPRRSSSSSLPPARTVPRRSPRWRPRGATSPPPPRPLGRLAAAGVHPFAAPLGELNAGERYELTEAEYGDGRPPPARLRAPGPRGGRRRRPLARGVQRPAPVPAAARRARRQRAVPRRPRHRPRLDPPEDLRAAARARGCRPRSAPGRRSPTRSPGAPRPARCPSRGAGGGSCARIRRTGRSSSACPTRRRPSPRPRAVAALVHALVAWLAERHDAGEPLATADTWRIEENRWSAARWGMDGALADLRTGERDPRARVPAPRCSTSSSRSPARLGGAAELAAVARAGGAQRRGAPARAGRAGRRRGRSSRGSRTPTCPAATTRSRYRGDRPPCSRSPIPAASTTDALLARPARRARTACRRSRCPTAATRSPTRTSSSRSTCCYELHYRGLPGVDERWEWAPSLLALRARARGALRGRAARGGRPGARRAARPRRWTSRCARSRTPTTASVAVAARRARGDARPGARVPGPPLRLPAQGGRPALVGDPAPERAAEGGARRDPGRRVRRRPARAHARAALRRRDGRARPRRALRRLRRPAARA